MSKTSQIKTLGTAQSGAIFSDDMHYRFRLWRVWDSQLPRACFLLLNPSTATEVDNDPTIERQQRRVQDWNHTGLFSAGPPRRFGAIEIVNACAWRSTDPQELFMVDDPVGDENGEMIQAACEQAVVSKGIIVCGWGAHLRKLPAVGPTLYDVLLEALVGFPLTAFKLNYDGSPQHPLYLPYNLRPRRWVPAKNKLYEEVV